jgi:hypothetical protein
MSLEREAKGGWRRGKWAWEYERAGRPLDY